MPSRDRAAILGWAPGCGRTRGTGAAGRRACLRRPGDRVPRAPRPPPPALTREALVELGGEAELVMAGDPLDPAARHLGSRGPVERRVDLDGVEVVREVPQRIEALGLGDGVDLALPVRVVPARRAEPDRTAARGQSRHRAAE